MERVLNEIASKLNVQVVVKERVERSIDGACISTEQWLEHRDVTDEVRELFKKELENHLFNKLQNMKDGEYVEYGFDYGDVRPLGTIMENANDNLAEVLLKLPALNDGETYSFPCDTYIRFTYVDQHCVHVEYGAKSL